MQTYAKPSNFYPESVILGLFLTTRVHYKKTGVVGYASSDIDLAYTTTGYASNDIDLAYTAAGYTINDIDLGCITIGNIEFTALGTG